VTVRLLSERLLLDRVVAFRAAQNSRTLITLCTDTDVRACDSEVHATFTVAIEHHLETESSNWSATLVLGIVEDERQPGRPARKWINDILMRCGQDITGVMTMTMTEGRDDGEHSWLAPTVLAKHSITGGGGTNIYDRRARNSRAESVSLSCVCHGYYSMIWLTLLTACCMQVFRR